MLNVPDHQVAGHQAGNGHLGPLTDDSGRFYKPLQGDHRGSDELSFYKSLSSNTAIPNHISRFFPKFYGTQLLEASDGSGVRSHLVLQNLTFGRINPSVMDIKIGSRTWSPQSPEDYIHRCLIKDRETSSLHLGFRMSGLQIFEGVGSGRFWKPEDRASVQSLSADGVRLLLKKFVSRNGALDSEPDCAFASAVYGGGNGLLSQLLELKEWFEDQTMYHFCSCSILMMFEEEAGKAEMKLVDFAHVLEGEGVIDHNFLGGLCSFIKFMSQILNSMKHCGSENGCV